MTPIQLPLPFPDVPDHAAPDLLQAPSNAEALAWLRNTARWPGGRLVIWGEPACGKTHMLTAWAGARGGTVCVAAEIAGLPVLNGGGLAIDDAGGVADERAMLHLLNVAQEAGVPVLMAERMPPARWPVHLPDLASRLRGTTAVRILPPEDELLRALLARLLSSRQIAVAASVQDWLLRRIPRTPEAVRAAAAALDEAALADGTGVTRGVANRVLARFGAEEAAETSR